MTCAEGIQQFLDFIETIEDDARIGMSHMSLYNILLYEYIKSASRLPIYVDRNSVMHKAKMCRKTYNKRMKELQQFGYISYHPTFDPSRKSEVYLKRL